MGQCAGCFAFSRRHGARDALVENDQAALDEAAVALEELRLRLEAEKLCSIFRLMSGKVIEGDFQGISSTADARRRVADALGWPCGAVTLLATKSTEPINDEDVMPRQGEDEVMVIVNAAAVQAHIDRFLVGLPKYNPPSPLMFACLKGDAETVQMLLLNGTDPNEVDEHRGGMTPLHAAARSATQTWDGQHVAGRRFSAEGKQAALAVAPAARAATLCRLLLAAGAEVNAADSQGKTALHHAVGLRNVDAFRALVCGGADRHAGRPTPTQLIMETGDLDLIEKFCDHVVRAERQAFVLPNSN